MNDLHYTPCQASALQALAFTADQLGPKPAPRRLWHVANMVPAKAVTLLQGDGGTGKSLLALQLAASTVLGHHWLDMEVRRGPAIYLSAEDDRDEVHRRLEAITTEYGASFADLAGLKVIDVTAAEAVFAAANRNGRLEPTPRWNEFFQVALDWVPRLIVIDNLADVFAGEENSRPHARQFITQLQSLAVRTGAACLLIGHPSLAGMASGSGSRGSTAWNNSVRSRLYLTKPARDDGATFARDARVLTVKKANYGPADAAVHLHWCAGAFKVDRSAEANLSGLDRQIAQNLVDATFLDLLTTYTARGRTVSPNKGHSFAPSLFSKDPMAKGVTSKGLTEAMNRLFAAGTIVVETAGPPSRLVARIVRREVST